jgi:hypothetical protein
MPAIIENDDEKWQGVPDPPGGYTPPSNVETSSGTATSTPNDVVNTGKFTGIGGQPELWRIGEPPYTFVMVYYAPGDFDPPIATMWEVPDEETLLAFGGGKRPIVDKFVTQAEIDSAGAIMMGSTDLIPEAELDPWTGFKARIDRAAKVQPWLADPEVYALIGAAYVEGRALEDWELFDTEWYRSRNDREKAWAEISLANPSEAESMQEQDKLKVRMMFEAIGAAGNSDELIEYMATRYTTGQWNDTHLTAQIEAVSSGWGTLDEDLNEWMKESGSTGIQTIDRQDEIRSMFSKWLGPAYPPNDALVKEWATKLRNNASGDEQLTAYLKGQRSALYPEYENPDLTYEDIAAPWRSVMSRMWGETPDETGGTFQQLVKMNDLGGAEKLLRTEGRAAGNSTVMKEYSKSMQAASGGSVRRAL